MRRPREVETGAAGTSVQSKARVARCVPPGRSVSRLRVDHLPIAVLSVGCWRGRRGRGDAGFGACWAVDLSENAQKQSFNGSASVPEDRLRSSLGCAGMAGRGGGCERLPGSPTVSAALAAKCCCSRCVRAKFRSTIVKMV